MSLSLEVLLLLAALMFVAAALYTSVGHGGASAYLALMALFSVSSEVMRPVALALNLVAASIGSVRFINAGMFSWRLTWPFLVGSIPFAYLGGTIDLPDEIYRPLTGLILLAAAARFVVPSQSSGAEKLWRVPPIATALGLGAGIGLLSGLTGTGGGIFLSPLLLLLRWSDTRTSAGVAALFIFCNSAAGLLANSTSGLRLPSELPIFFVAIVAGAALGTAVGIHRFSPGMFRAVLALVLTGAGLKLITLS